MRAFSNIVFPVDFSERSAAAAPYVSAIAARFHSELTLLHVLEPAPEVYGPMESNYVEMRDSELRSWLKDQFSGPNVNRVLAVGDPARKITEIAAARGADLIMMPTHGYGPFRRFILGSVTAKVLHDAECPVWTAAHLEEAPSNRPDVLRNLVCAVDCDAKGRQLLTQSAELAEVYGARLTVVHAVSSTEARPGSYFDSEFRLTLINLAHKELKEMMTGLGIQAPLCIEAGEIAHVIKHSAVSHKADLLVIGRGSPGLMGRLKTHSYSIIRESPCPVLSM